MDARKDCSERGNSVEVHYLELLVDKLSDA